MRGSEGKVEKGAQAQWFVLGAHIMEFIVYGQVLFVGGEDNCFP
jgi:hypothetical protein